MTRKTKMTESVLYHVTYRLLETRPRGWTYAMLEQATGVPEAWIKAFGQGRMENPSVVRVEKLYNALAEEPLELPYDV